MPTPTNAYKEYDDYKEAFNAKAKGPIYIGSRKLPRSKDPTPENLAQILKPLSDDIDAKGSKSDFYGCILYPERKNHREGRTDAIGYTDLKNEAFLAGAIDSGRPIILVTDITLFKDVDNKTVDEMFWLQDNGYTFRVNPANPIQTIFDPPSVPKPEHERIIKNYDLGNGLEAGNRRELSERFNTIKESVSKQRLDFSRSKASESTAAASPSASILREGEESAAPIPSSAPAPPPPSSTPAPKAPTASTSAADVYIPPGKREKETSFSNPAGRLSAAPTLKAAGSAGGVSTSPMPSTPSAGPVPPPPTSSAPPKASGSSSKEVYIPPGRRKPTAEMSSTFSSGLPPAPTAARPKVKAAASRGAESESWRSRPVATSTASPKDAPSSTAPSPPSSASSFTEATRLLVKAGGPVRPRVEEEANPSLTSSRSASSSRDIARTSKPPAILPSSAPTASAASPSPPSPTSSKPSSSPASEKDSTSSTTQSSGEQNKGPSV